MHELERFLELERYKN